MRAAVSLYEFMPYGAPDLIESRRRHLSHALCLASGMAIAFYALTTGVAALIRPAPEQTMTIVDVFPHVLVRPQWEPRRPSPPAPAKARISPAMSQPAVVQPVSDDIAPESQKIESSTVPVIDDAPAGTVPSGAITGQPVSEALPGRLDWVYVEDLPKPVRQVKPDYPELPLKAGIDGAVTVFVLVGKDGRVLAVELSEKIQVPMLNEAALAAARQWVFTPGIANGKPVACWTAIPFRFRIN